MRKLIAIILLTACTAAPPPASTPAAPVKADSYGFTREGAIEVCDPNGERAYLRRLRCSDGEAPRFNRLGSVGSRTEIKTKEDEKAAMDQMMADVPAGQRDFHTLDLYEVACSDKTVELFLDMYHCKAAPPSEAPAGFTIVK